ncbi:response regulator transcription factor [Vibrio sp. SM6]|uniref:Response regulator transcription factor n=1 Tax=Vibrio agarilyticus TaxID=2726741 RepID=A0A7X8YIG4_9VIBR|nr:response regulator transcription factor [Vibrio agarilyticus]NLS14590.1 response regulator transcription factor [Vibrio agarilyticus]
MNRSSYARVIYTLTLDPLNITQKLKVIEHHFERAIPSIAPKELMKANPKHRNKILLLHYSEHQALLKALKQLPLAWKKFETVLIGVPQRLSTEALLSFGDLKAIFYHDQSPQEIAHGLNQVVNGVNWLPRNVTSQLLHYYRNVVDTHTSPVTVDLTIREIQVLRYLQNGSSNHQIAEDMFISEYTVKSHLYQIYKKLAVKNRLQATAWADLHLNE